MIALGHPKLAALNARRDASPNGPGHFHVLDADRRVRITLDGETVAESDRAVALKEVGMTVYDPVYYVPRADAAMDRLRPVAGKTTHCPIKGDATYFALAGGSSEWVAWSYEAPLDFSAPIAGLVAFDAARVVIEVHPSPQP